MHDTALVFFLVIWVNPPVFSGVRVARSLFFWLVFCSALFVLFFLAIVLFVLLRFTVSDYPFKLFSPHPVNQTMHKHVVVLNI
jgi:hypothetical protein